LQGVLLVNAFGPFGLCIDENPVGSGDLLGATDAAGFNAESLKEADQNAEDRGIVTDE